MRTFLARAFATATMALVLVACGVTVGPGEPPTADRSVVSRSGVGPPQAVLNLSPGQTTLIRVDVPSAQRAASRRLVVEADDDDGFSQLDMVLYASNGVTPIASTSGTAFFRPGLSGVGRGFIGTSLEVEPFQVAAGACLGPCISHSTTASVYYVEIRSTTTVSVSVPFYAFTESWITPNEPQNDGPGGAVSVAPGPGFQGVIERINDVDHLRFSTGGMIAFDMRAGYDTNLELDIFTPGGTYVTTVYPGDPAFQVFANEYGRIRSDPSDRRASVYGLYFVYYE